MNEDLLSIASDIVDKARRLDACEVDAYVTESSVQVCKGDVERVIDAGSLGVGVPTTLVSGMTVGGTRMG